MSETEGMSPTVKTFVIFDTETTGLPNSSDSPRITELSFIALSRDGLLDASKPSRVASKLLLCFNPQKEIDPKASSLSGLKNDALEVYGTFESHASLICSFLTRLPQPACLVAHNGNRFDFPILISELSHAGEPVPVNILCVDSMKGFSELDANDSGQKAPSYALSELYKRIFGRDPIASHTAEDDCKTLLSVIQTYGLSFCQWSDQNAVPLVNKSKKKN
ncbi:unnamed protein product [Lymnaea stagnalis]|uniref:Exonuclease domain-containing protein n=1 Tax=Lymnaea stagnalis TaxID=6523 RepID=A0AAV2IB70_LYMST